MKKDAYRIAAIGLCAAVAAGSLGSVVYAHAASGGLTSAPAAVQRLSAAEGASPAYKDETVYILTDAGGGIEKVIVSDWLKNPDGCAALRDETTLTDVENVKGAEGYTTDGGALIWDAQGGDIYCQGSTGKELPVDMSVSYLLDGEPVTPEELAGRSGQVTIRYDFTNNEFRLAEVNGKQEKIYVPFAMLTGLVLDNEIFSNVEVSSGRVYSDGSRTIVAGLAFPGLAENLDLDPDLLDIPDFVEITADVREFELANTVTIASNGVFRDLDTSKLDSFDGLSDSIGELNDAMDLLLDGSSQLYDGLCELLDKSGGLTSGINQLAEGMDALQAAAGELTAGAAQLQTGAADLQTGLEALCAKNDTLNGGARQVFDTLLASANAQLLSAGLELPALTADNYAGVLEGVIAQMPYGSEPVAAVKASLDSYSAFCQGLQSYTAGVAEAAAGAAKLNGGAASLASGMEQLSGGIGQVDGGVGQLQDGVPALMDGIGQLRDGALALNEGLHQFDEKGIQRLTDAVDGDWEGLAQRFQATVDAAEGYTSFSSAGDTDGQVKFLYRTEAIALAE